jgi:formiminotetrahydrofolate cyclodeaminase
MPTLRETTLGQYLEHVSSSSPTPGGGGVAAIVASLGAALGAMVTSLTSKKSENEEISALAAKCADYRETFLRLSAADECAFDSVMAALKLPKDDPTRTEQVEATVQAAAQAPLEVAKACLDFLIDLESLVTLASRHSISDVGAAAYLVLAALRASLLNVHINITFMKDQAAANAFEISASKLESNGAVRSQHIVEQVIARIRQ